MARHRAVCRGNKRGHTTIIFVDWATPRRGDATFNHVLRTRWWIRAQEYSVSMSFNDVSLDCHRRALAVIERALRLVKGLRKACSIRRKRAICSCT